jgi:serine/threonine protein kinase
MKIMTFRKRASAHLPPLIKQPKIYTIRKNNRCHYSSEISYNPDTQTKPFNSERNLLELKQDTPLAYSLNEFEISKCVSKGKGGCVLMATLNYRNYALKVIHKKLSKYALAEAKILDKLSSQLIVKYFGRFEDEENIYLVLEFINGCDFFHYMSRKRLKLPEIVNLASQVLSAIELIHSKGIVYRDLKPENIMLPESGCIKLIDFGLSKEIGNERTSTVCGSPEYMAPEVIRKNSYSYAVDFWSFGILLYEMLCG